MTIYRTIEKYLGGGNCMKGYKVDSYDVNIDIKLKNGVYRMQSESSIGKTYLSKTLDSYNELGEPVYCITYKDTKDKNINITLENLLKYKVIMFDRYDMYSNFYHNIIRELCNRSIVLLDSKVNPNIEGIHGGIGYCFLSRNDNCIEVK